MKNEIEEHDVVFENMVFPISEEKSASYIHNRYSMGKLDGRILSVNKFEIMYLIMKHRVVMQNGEIPDQKELFLKLMTPDDIPMMKVYHDLKNGGGRITVSGNILYLTGKKEKSTQRKRIMPIRENHRISFKDLVEMDHTIIASVDDDGDITYYKIEIAHMKGDNSFQWTEYEFSELGNRGVTGISDVPAWIGDVIGDIRILSEQEKPILESGKSEDTPTKVFYHLIRNGFIVKTGFKYGCNFRAYEGSVDDHAQFLVHVMTGDVEWYEISRAVRVAASVRKKMVFASIHEKNVETVEIKRVKNIRNI